MNLRLIVSSVFLGLTLPAIAVASVPTPSSLSSLNQEQFSKSGTVEIAQRHLSAEYVGARLYNSESQILRMAYEYSNGKPIEWKNISVEYPNSQVIKLNIHGKIKRKRKDGSIRIGIFIQRNSQGYFRVVDYDWSTGRCRKPCKKRVRRALQNMPLHFPRFQQVFNRIIS
ncbi:hypothetical protein [Moorena sp. SIO3B2]|uniref:hypothetical protein n=1 Tax=Moorena sp. SIO3B2 TaxID=2607827 RepID=UPI0013C7564D|nr:hypothetical protein [Moorena sp. SIO3B2]NEP35978.1 hypothetical protein [Moorena sp. SIO3B2]